MTNEQAIAKALIAKLDNRYLAEKGNVDLDYIEDQMKKAIEELRGREIPETLADRLSNRETAKTGISNEITTATIKKARAALYDILSEVIMNTDFDPDLFISGITYWYEFQQLAKAYGKRLFYVAPKSKKEGK